MTDLIERVAARAGWTREHQSETSRFPESTKWHSERGVCAHITPAHGTYHLTDAGQLFLLDALLKGGWEVSALRNEFRVVLLDSDGEWSRHRYMSPDLPTALMEAYMAMESER